MIIVGSVAALSQQLQIKHLSLACPAVMDPTQLKTPAAEVPVCVSLLCGGVGYVAGFALFMAGCFSPLSSAGWLLPVQHLAAAGFRGWDTHLLIPLKFKRSNNFSKILCKAQLISILLLISFPRELTLAPVPTLPLNPFIPALRTPS